MRGARYGTAVAVGCILISAINRIMSQGAEHAT
jgi:hypothetical protein